MPSQHPTHRPFVRAVLLPLSVLLMGLIHLAAFPSKAGGADVTVIVNPAAPIDRINASNLGDLFLDKNPGIPGIEKADPIMLASGTPEHEQFIERVLGMSLRDWKRYWAKAIFNGQKTPPREVKSVDEVIAAVAADPNGVGVLVGEIQDDRVKTVQLVLP